MNVKVERGKNLLANRLAYGGLLDKYLMKLVIITSIIAGVIIVGAVFIGNNGNSQNYVQGNNVTMVGDKQIIVVRAKGGYGPRKSVAKAGIPTILRVDTNGTFDCSSIVRIPSMSIFKNLPQTGSTEIDLGSPKVGVLQGICGMGMYRFEIDFES